MVAPWILEHKDATSGYGIHAVILITHVIEAGPMTLDEKKLVKIQQRIGQRNGSTETADFNEEFKACVAVPWDCFSPTCSKAVQGCFQSIKTVFARHGLYVLEQA
jgi:hypothetical protein